MEEKGGREQLVKLCLDKQPSALNLGEGVGILAQAHSVLAGLLHFLVQVPLRRTPAEEAELRKKRSNKTDGDEINRHNYVT